MTADRWQHPDWCEWWRSSQSACDCGLSALRDAVAAGDPLAVLDVLGMGGTLVPRVPWHSDPGFVVVRPLPDTPEVSP